MTRGPAREDVTAAVEHAIKVALVRLREQTGYEAQVERVWTAAEGKRESVIYLWISIQHERDDAILAEQQKRESP